MRLRRSHKNLGLTAIKHYRIQQSEAFFLCKLAEMGLNPHNYGLHSMRSSAATISANNGTLDRLWKRHGRWVSDRAKDGYVADNLQTRLSVTLGLGL